VTRNVTPIIPGAAIGVLGSGQLGRMFAIAARQMGYRVHTFSPETDTPTGQVSDVEIAASYDDLDAVRGFARGVQAVTFEFENVPAACVEAAAAYVPVRPGGAVLHTTQNRLREKTFLSNNGFPTTVFAPVRRKEDLSAALAQTGLPAILKTASSGYDGKGQAKVASLEEAAKAFEDCGGQEMVAEGFVDFELEFSVVLARGLDGSFAHWGAIQNRHKHHILDLSTAPAQMSETATSQAIELARALAQKLELIGVLCIEFFLTRKGAILVNELAPRPHNSGHLTINASRTSQFEQQLRAVCGLPLGSTEFVAAAAMANLLGDLWQPGEPNWLAPCALPDVKLHLYGKIEPRPGRKMGHLTALAASPDLAAQMVLLARQKLQPVCALSG
jgi:5-(carboxyamino)imidazole ribonucleotide synthase